MLKGKYRILICFFLSVLPLVASTDRSYVLCEGNFMTSNASLWSHDGTGISQVSFSGGILGDTGQSLTLENDQLYVVCNNSNNIEVLDLSSEGENLNRTILLTNASPRYIVFNETAAYISCWLIPGILVLDKEEDTILDTIPTAGKPEDMVIVGDKLYVSLIEESDSYDKNNKVQEIDISTEAQIRRTFTVAPGPEHLVYKDSILYAGSTCYDESWNAQIALSRIDLKNGDVLINHLNQTTGYSGSDLVILNDTLYYAIQNGIYAIDPQTLQPASEPIVQVADGLFIYSLSIHDGTIWLGLTDDYVAPDYVYRYTREGSFIDQYSVGASPGDFTFYESFDTVGIHELIPESIELGSPYPNPFNARVTIPIRVLEETYIKVTIYSVRGEIVSEEEFSAQKSGWQQYQWNAADVPSGIYMVSVSDAGTMINKKIILLK